MLGSVFVYLLVSAGVMRFYKDDPTHMDLADRQKFNLNYLSTLDATKKVRHSSVLKTLGSPDITEAKQVGDAVYQVMFYRTRKIRDDNITTKDECTALLFLNGLLIAWGSDAYNQYKSYG